jgi:hypothetical protein
MVRSFPNQEEQTMTDRTRPDADPQPRRPLPRPRRDGFDGDRKREFLDYLGRGGCLRDAARKVGVSHQTVYNHQNSDPEFREQCDLAMKFAGTDIELQAYKRGVLGVEEPIVWRGEIVGTRVKRSDAMLRLLLQGAKPEKYGHAPGFRRGSAAGGVSRSTDDRFRRPAATAEETDAEIDRKLDLLDKRLSRERAGKGWTQADDGRWIPPGWVRDGASAIALAAPRTGGERWGDSV